MKKTTKITVKDFLAKNYLWVRAAVIIIVFALGYAASYIIFWEEGPKVGLHTQYEAALDERGFALFWEAWHKLEEIYAFEEPIDQEKLFGAVSGLAASYDDPHTTFLPPEDDEYFRENVSGEFFGIGAEISEKNDQITVVAPLKNSPAEIAGLQPGDVILSVDGESVAQKNTTETVQKIRGEEGKNVELTIYRPGDPAGEQKIAIVRQKIEIPNLTKEYFPEDKIFAIALYSFSAHAHEDIYSALQEFIDSGAQYLILDLRNNPGGFLEQANRVASIFLEHGDIIVRESRGENTIEKEYRADNNGKLHGLHQKNFVILVNKGSASASEILAGALQDHGRATVIGTNTFGKGSVQELVDMKNGGSLKVTIARWLTPNRRVIDDDGLRPDIIISDEELRKHIQAGIPYDIIFEKAKGFLRGEIDVNRGIVEFIGTGVDNESTE